MLDGRTLTIQINARDFERLPERIRDMVRDATLDSGIPRGGVLTVHMPAYRWDEIQAALRSLPR